MSSTNQSFESKKSSLLLYLVLIIIAFKLMVTFSELILLAVFKYADNSNLFSHSSEAFYYFISFSELITYIGPALLLLYYLKKKKAFILKTTTKELLDFRIIGNILAVAIIFHLLWKFLYPPLWDIVFSAFNVGDFFITYAPEFIVTVLFAPVFEELLFRKYFISELKVHYSPKRTIIISSIFFSLLHLPIYASLIPTFFAGIVAGSIYYKTKNIVYPISFHLFLNSLYFLEITTDDFLFDYKLGIADFKIWGGVILVGFCLIRSIKFIKELYRDIKTQN